MKKKLGSLLITLLTAVCTYGQTSSLSGDKNYIVTYSPRKEGIKLPSDLSNKPANEVNQSVQYFDGLGRPMQTVETFASPGKKDIIQHIEYDAYGREVKKYLPYTEGASYGTYRSNALSSQAAFYNNGLANGVVEIPSVNSITPSFAETKFEPSSLNRVEEQGAAGAVWQLAGGHTVKTVYGANAASEVALWTISGNTASFSNAFYGANQLYKTIIKDENWTSGTSGTTEEFKDKQGRVVLKRIWESETVSLSTYYIYDDLGNLRYVVPPGVIATSFTESSSDNPFTQFIYAYHYDYRNRLIEKKIPGKGWEYIIYNKLDQVVATQDANQRVSGQWLFTKYDAFGRVVVTGLYNDPAVRSTVQGSADAVTVLWESRGTTATYSSSAFPTSGTTNLTVNYYDDYTFGPNYVFATPHTYDQQQTTRTKGLLTGSLVNTLGTSTYLQTVNYYNEDGRLIQTFSQNHLNGVDRIDNKYSFTGELTASTRIHSSSAGDVTIANRYVYDHVGRKKQTFQTTGGAGNTEVKLSELEYNEIGQLKEKKLHDDLQSTTYTYNPRGWLKSSTSDQFSMSLNYEDGTYPQWNGNIANQSYTNGSANTFTYQYDKLNRLLSGVATGMSESLSYDMMGNITSLTRNGISRGYTYHNSNYSNRLYQVAGLTNPYQYDADGNVTYDGKNNVSISYNLLNLPVTAGGVTYTYDATGRKLKKQSSTTTDYVGGIQYTNGAIDFIQTEEGRALNTGGSYKYEYNLTDHLGNVRYSFDIYNNAPRRIQQDDYYPFGLRAASYAGSPDNKYLYNGKELQDELGQYDYGARFYDPVIARWSNVDPLAELGRRWSPYTYAFNNPISFTDPDGMWPADSRDPFGEKKDRRDPGENHFDGESPFDRDRSGSNNSGGSSTRFFNVNGGYSVCDKCDEEAAKKSANKGGESWDLSSWGNFFWGKGSPGVEYNGKGIGGTNYAGKGPLTDPRILYSQGLRYIDEIDRATYYHDIDYFLNDNAGGAKDVFLNRSPNIIKADLNLAVRALDIIVRGQHGGIDQVTHQQISPRTINIATAVYLLFAPVSVGKQASTLIP